MPINLIRWRLKKRATSQTAIEVTQLNLFKNLHNKMQLIKPVKTHDYFTKSVRVDDLDIFYKNRWGNREVTIILLLWAPDMQAIYTLISFEPCSSDYRYS